LSDNSPASSRGGPEEQAAHYECRADASRCAREACAQRRMQRRSLGTVERCCRRQPEVALDRRAIWPCEERDTSLALAADHDFTTHGASTEQGSAQRPPDTHVPVPSLNSARRLAKSPCGSTAS
jgi:hypothetical protein